MISFTEEQAELKYYFEIRKSCKRNYIISDNALYYVPEKDKFYMHETKDGFVFFDMPDSIIKVSDCYMHIKGIMPHLPTNQKQKYTINLSLVPCNFEEDRIINLQFEFTVNNGKFSFPKNKFTGFAENHGFSVWNTAHFCNALHDLLKEALLKTENFPHPYFFTGYKGKRESFVSEFIKDSFLPTYPDYNSNIDLQNCIADIENYICKNKSSGMLCLYSILSFTYPFIGKYIYNGNTPFSGLPMESFNYYGDNINAVHQDVNLFANFFEASNRNDMKIKYNVTLDSANYCLDNYTIFKDVPLIVRRIRGSITPKNKKLAEIIDLRNTNNIGFFPVIISNNSLKIAEVFSVECTGYSLLNSSDYKKLKSRINTFFKRIINFLNSNRKMLKNYPYPINNNDIDSYMFNMEYTDSVMTIFLQQALDIVCFVLDKMNCEYFSLQSLLRKILSSYSINQSMLPPNADNADISPIISKVLNFVKNTYEKHKDDVPQKTIWISEYNNITDGELFSPYPHDNRLVYINNKILQDFIEKNLHANALQAKKLLYSKNIILKHTKGYTYKKHDKGEHVCICFYAEYLKLSDRNNHLSLN